MDAISSSSAPSSPAPSGSPTEHATTGNSSINRSSTQAQAAVGGAKTNVSTTAATAASALIVDQGVQDTLLSMNVPSGLSMAAESIFPNPSVISAANMNEGLNAMANDYNEVHTLANAFASDVHMATNFLKESNGESETSSAATTATPSDSTSTSTAASPTETTTSTESTTTSSTTTSSSSEAPGAFSWATILGELATLANATSATLAAGETANVASIDSQANATIGQANNMIKGAGAMEAGAITSLSMSVAVAGVGVGGAASATSAGNKAEGDSAIKANENVETHSGSASAKTTDAIEHVKTTPKDSGVGKSSFKAKESTTELRAAAKQPGVNSTVAKHANDTADSLDKANEYSLYQTGGPKAGEVTAGNFHPTEDETDANGPVKKPDGTTKQKSLEVTDTDGTTREMTPEEATNHHLAKAKASQTQLKEAVDPDKIKANMKANKSSSAFNQAFSARMQEIQPFTNLGTVLAQTSNAMMTAQAQIDSAHATMDSAASQAQGAAVQSSGQTISQESDLANTLRGYSSSVAGDMAENARSV